MSFSSGANYNELPLITINYSEGNVGCLCSSFWSVAVRNTTTCLLQLAEKFSG